MIATILTAGVLGILVLPISVSGATESAAAEEDPALTAMRAISFLAGNWAGEGWMRRGPGEPALFSSQEMIESRLDGRLLIVEGIHRDKTTDEIVHHAVATISYDGETKGYGFRSHLASGRSGDHAARLEDGDFIWGGEVPGRGHMRYVISVSKDTWHEVGEFSADGESWQQFFQMDLKRVD